MLLFTSYTISNWLTSQSYQDTYITLFMVKITACAAALTWFFFMINLGWQAIPRAIKGEKFIFDKLEIGRCIVISMAIGIYPFIMGVVMWLATAMGAWSDSFVDQKFALDYGKELIDQYYMLENDVVDPNAIQAEKQKNLYLGNQSTTNQNPINPATQGPNTITDTATFGFMSFLTGEWMLKALCSLFYVISVSLKSIILAFSTMALKILYLIGPLAFAFSVFPTFKEKIGEWFSAFVGLAFVPVTLNIIHSVVCAEMQSLIMLHGTTTLLSSLIMNVTAIFMYISCFWLTSKYVGSDGAGKVFSTGIQTMMQVAQIAVTAMPKPALPTPPSGGGAAGSAIDSAKQGFEK